MKTILKRASATALAIGLWAGGLSIASAAPQDSSPAEDLSSVCVVDERGEIDPDYPCGVMEVASSPVREGAVLGALVEGKPNATVTVVISDYHGVLVPGAQTQANLGDEGFVGIEMRVPKLGEGFTGGVYYIGFAIDGAIELKTAIEVEILSERADYMIEFFGSGTADDPWEFGLVNAYPGHSYKMQYLNGEVWKDLIAVDFEPADEYGFAYVFAVAPEGSKQTKFVVRAVNRKTGATSPAVDGVEIGNPPKLTAATAGTKRIGEYSAAWGYATGVPFESQVATQVRVGNRWSTSQRGTVNPDTGFYALPLTYGKNTPGTYTYRVGVRTAVRWIWSEPMQFTRVGVTAATAGRKKVRQVSNVWGLTHLRNGAPVVTQVMVKGKWSTSQRGKTDAAGRYVLPLTYGAKTPGTYTYRVGVHTPTGWVWSSNVKLTRTR